MIATSKGMTGKNRALIRNQPKLICKKNDGIKIYLSPLVVGSGGGVGPNIGQASRTEQGAAGQGVREEPE